MTLKDRTHRYLENGTWVERNLSASAQGPLAKAAYFYVDRWAALQQSGSETHHSGSSLWYF